MGLLEFFPYPVHHNFICVWFYCEIVIGVKDWMMFVPLSVAVEQSVKFAAK